MSRKKEIPELGLIGSSIVAGMLGVSLPTLQRMRKAKLVPPHEPFTSDVYPFWRKSVIVRYINGMKK